MSNPKHTLQIENISIPIDRDTALEIADAISERLGRELSLREFVDLMNQIDKNNPEFDIQFGETTFMFIIKSPQVYRQLTSPVL